MLVPLRSSLVALPCAEGLSNRLATLHRPQSLSRFSVNFTTLGATSFVFCPHWNGCWAGEPQLCCGGGFPKPKELPTQLCGLACRCCCCGPPRTPKPLPKLPKACGFAFCAPPNIVDFRTLLDLVAVAG